LLWQDDKNTCNKPKMLGKLLDGRYRVIQVLSAGGFGETYIAEDIRRPGNPRCVLKLLKPGSFDPYYLQTARRLFNSEAEIL
jgi:serine/threonine-protein kinase